jgi:cobalt-zinc-cadmium efflux system outer membrane protein
MTASILLGASCVFSADPGLESLIRAGLRDNPDLRVSSQDAGIAARDTLSARLLPNPVLSLEALRNLDDAQSPKTSIRISQEFRPGVRQGLYKTSQANFVAKKEWQRVQELDLEFDIRSAYFAWQVAHRKSELQDEVQRRWERLSRLAATKASEGRISGIESSQAELNLEKSRRLGMKIRGDMETLEKRLAALTGREKLQDSIRPSLSDTLPPLPSLDSLQAWANAESPELKALAREADAQAYQAAFERSLRNPSFSISLGYEREPEGASLFGGGIEVPLPLFNRNQGGISRADAQLRQARLKTVASKANLESALAQMHANLERLSTQYRDDRGGIQALVHKQLRLSEKGFEQGLLGVFELSKAQEEALDLDMEALDVLGAFYEEWNRLGRTVGGKTW